MHTGNRSCLCFLRHTGQEQRDSMSSVDFYKNEIYCCWQLFEIFLQCQPFIFTQNCLRAALTVNELRSSSCWCYHLCFVLQQCLAIVQIFTHTSERIPADCSFGTEKPNKVCYKYSFAWQLQVLSCSGFAKELASLPQKFFCS